MHWAIPEIRRTPPKEDMGIPKFLHTFFIGNSQKNNHSFGREGKEDLGIPKNFDHFWYKKWEFPIFFYCF